MQAKIYLDFFNTYDFQDEGHTGKIHDAVSETLKHYGMFIFDLGEYHDKYIAFKLVLNVKSLETNSEDDKPFFDIIPGGFSIPDMITKVDFIDDISLERCGWEPVVVPSGSTGPNKQVKYTVLSGFGKKLIIDFVFNFTGRYLGFLIVPYVLFPGKHFSLDFYRVKDSQSVRPMLKCQSATTPILLSDEMAGKDHTRYLDPKVLANRDHGIGYDRFKYETTMKRLDDGYLFDKSNGVKIRGTDPVVNYSMQINHINLSDNGKIIEVYGFNGYTERYYYPDRSKAILEKVSIEKLNVVTWSGLLVEFPWASMLWYGEIIYFADMEEFGECCRLYFKEHGDDACPVCGKPLGNQLQYSYIDVTKIPHQIYFCSKECIKKFNANMIIYLYMFRLQNNIEYITSIQI